MIKPLTLLFYTNADCTNKFGEFTTTKPLILGNKFPMPINLDDTVEEKQLSIDNSKGVWTIRDISFKGTYMRLTKNVPYVIPYGPFIVCGLTWVDTSDFKKIRLIDKDFKELLLMEVQYNKLYVIGKGIEGDNLVNPNDKKLSGNHAKLIFTEKNITVMDWKKGEGSLNGTFISVLPDFKVKENVSLRIGYETFCCLDIGIPAGSASLDLTTEEDKHEIPTVSKPTNSVKPISTKPEMNPSLKPEISIAPNKTSYDIITEMGYSSYEATMALELCQDNLENAVNLLLESKDSYLL